MAKITLEALTTKSLNRIGAVNPNIKNRAIEIVKQSYKQNIYVIFSQGLRTMEEQASLYGQGRSSYIYKGKQYGNPKLPIVTQAPPGTSIHNYGLALDFFLCNEDGSGAFWTVNDKWMKVVKIAKSLGFDWGGDWTSFKDYPHFEWTGNLTYTQVFAGKVPTFPSLNSSITTVSKPKEPAPTKKTEYYTSNPGKVKLLTTCNLYTSVEFNDKTKAGINYPKGTVFTVKEIKKSKAGTPRLIVSNGKYVLTANKANVTKI